MDTGKGKFEMFDSLAEARAGSAALGRASAESGVFEKGEFISIRGSTFRIERITKTHLVLRLQKR